jgi:glycosyltransferase involved in cell wall biosynthesis
MHIGISSPISIQTFIPFLNSKNQERAINLQGLKAPAVDTLVIGLLERGHKISIYTLSFEVTKTVVLSGNNITIYVNPLRKKGWKRAITLFSKESKHIINNINSEKNKPDILHAQWTYEYAKGVLGFRNEIPVLITVRDWAPKILSLSPNYYRFSRLLLNNIVLSTKPIHLIANSEYIQKEIKKKWKKNSYYIPNPINDVFFDKDISGRKNKSVIISVSNNLGKGKNIEILLKAFKEILKDMPTLELLLVGIPFVNSNVQVQKWREKNLLERVTIVGAVEHNKLIDYYDRATIMVHPSLEESFGNTIIEAMSRNVAVIGGVNSGAVPFLLQYGKYGLLTDVRSVNEIKKSLLCLFNDTAKREYLIKSAYHYTKTSFSKKSIIDNTESLYNFILNEKN